MNRAYSHTYGLLWRGEVDWIADTVRAVLIRGSEYAFASPHQFLSQIPGAARAGDVVLSGREEIGGAVFADPATWPTVPVGDDVTAVVIYAEGASEATSPLLLWLDDLAGLPRPTGGTDITLAWPGSGIAGLVDGAVEFPDPAPPEVESRVESTIYDGSASGIAVPEWAEFLLIDAIGGGAGGASGFARTTSSTTFGGGGGGGGDCVSRLVPRTALSGAISVTIGAGGAGGAAVVGNGVGLAGVAGGNTTVSDGSGALVTAAGGVAGRGPTSTSVDSVDYVGGHGIAGASINSGIPARGGLSAVSFGPGSGGSGGAGNNERDGGNGGAGAGDASTGGGLGGTSSTVDNGAAGISVAAEQWGGGGGGGGGRGRNGSGAPGGSGGAGGWPGAGGGAGGGLINSGGSQLSGAGGAGGAGAVRLTWIGAQVVEE